MAAGYKVLCRCHGIERAAAHGRTSAIQKFDLFERRLRTARRRDGGQIGGEGGQILEMGKMRGKRRK